MHVAVQNSGLEGVRELNAITGAAVRATAGIERFSLREPDLDDVYFQLTGHARTAGAARRRAMTALPSRTSRQSAAWVASDYWEMAKRSLRHIRHDPEQLTNVTLQPVLIVLVADLLLGGAINTGTHGSYINFVMPGILVVAAAFAAITTTISVAADMLEGVIDRFRTLPMAKSAVITGHVIADLARA